MSIHHLNVLVVEDDTFQRQMIINMLRLLGITSISEAGNGRQALEAIHGENSKPVNIAFCDLNMPEMDGMEFMRHLEERHNNVAIVILSAQDKKLLSAVGRMAKMYGIKLLGTVEKPIALAHLKELLSKYDACAINPYVPDITARHFTLDEVLQGVHANQIFPFFQPKMDVKTGRIIGAEALARWVHPEYGVVGPNDFIPILEEQKKIYDLTFQMLEKSALACHTFLEITPGLTISVNLSLALLDDPGLADKIAQLVKNAGTDPKHFVLEITESAAMTDVALALENLTRLCMYGFALSIDDYGTGYSSMQQLTRIPFSELKIDQSFVKDFTDNEALRIVVESSIDMAHKLRIKSTAEGVETIYEWNTLKSMGCDIAQGFFIAKPMDKIQFQQFLETHNPKPSVPSSAAAQMRA